MTREKTSAAHPHGLYATNTLVRAHAHICTPALRCAVGFVTDAKQSPRTHSHVCKRLQYTTSPALIPTPSHASTLLGPGPRRCVLRCRGVRRNNKRSPLPSSHAYAGLPRKVCHKIPISDCADCTIFGRFGGQISMLTGEHVTTLSRLHYPAVKCEGGDQRNASSSTVDRDHDRSSICQV